MASSTRILAGVEDIPVSRQIIVNQAIVEIKQEEAVATEQETKLEVSVTEEVSSVEIEPQEDRNFFGFKVTASLSVENNEFSQVEVKSSDIAPEEVVPVTEEVKEVLVEPTPVVTTTSTRKRR